MTTGERVVITGVGAVSALGPGAEALFDAALRGRSGVRPWPPHDAAPRWAAAPAAVVPENATVDRHVGLALLAVREALSHANLAPAGADADRTGIYWGTGAGSAATMEDAYARLHGTPSQRPRPLTILLAMQNAAPAQIALDHQLRGPQLSVSQACASAAAAIGEALLALRLGRADRIVAGGSEAPLVGGQMLAWDGLRVLARLDPQAPERSCRPFDRARSGIVLGEGAAALVLERESSARARGAPVIAELCGYGSAADASHYARPDPAGQRRAMAMALDDAGLAADAIGYINAHATGTPVGDAAEARAIVATFGAAAQGIAVSSTKASHGHALGAAGALELVITALALGRGLLPPTAFLEAPDVEGLDLIRGAPRARAVAAALSNSFAFGGSNVSLVVRRYRERT